MSKTLTAEEFYKKNLGNIEFGIECVMKDTYNIKPFVFATAYANYLHKTKLENDKPSTKIGDLKTVEEYLNSL